MGDAQKRSSLKRSLRSLSGTAGLNLILPRSRLRDNVIGVRQNPKCDFYYICRETEGREVDLRARSIYTIEDPATGSAAGCTAAWMVRHGITQSEQTIHIVQGVEIKRPSHMFARATKEADRVTNVRVGGYAVQVMRGELFL